MKNNDYYIDLKEKILSNIEKKELKQKYILLNSAIEDIYKLTLKLNELSTERIDLVKNIQLLENKFALNISNELDNKGKKVFSNEVQRRAELIRQLDNNKEYLLYKQNNDNINITVKDYSSRIEYLKNIVEIFKNLI